MSLRFSYIFLYYQTCVYLIPIVFSSLMFDTREYSLYNIFIFIYCYLILKVIAELFRNSAATTN